MSLSTNDALNSAIADLEFAKLCERVRELEETNAELVQKLSAMADYFDLEWYDVPLHERYIEKGE